MSLLLYKQPNPLDFAGNNLFFKTKGTDFIEVKPVCAQLRLNMIKAQHIKSGEYLTMEFLGKIHLIKLIEDIDTTTDPTLCNGAPTDHVIYYSLSNGGAGRDADIEAGLKAYQPISDNYNVYPTLWILRITAKNPGPAYNINLLGSVILPALYFDHGWTLGISQVNKKDYHFRCSLFVENMSAQGTYHQLPEFRVDVDENQLSEIELSGIIRRKFLSFFDLPNYEAQTAIKCTFSKLNYYLTFKEMTGDTELSTLTTPVYSVLNGRINKSDHSEFNIRDWQINNKRFLTNMPGKMVTFGGCKHTLYYLNAFSGSSSINVKIVINHTSGEATTYSQTISDLVQDDIVMIPAGGIIGSLIADQASILYAECWVEDSAATLLAGKQMFIYRPQPLHGLSFLFLNSFGVFDAITVHTLKNQIKTEDDETTTTLTSGYSRYVGDIIADFTDGEDSFTAETGPITFEMANHLKELLSLRRVVFLQTSDRYLRVKIDSGSTTISDNEKDLCNVSFKYKSAFAGDLISQNIELPKIAHRDHSTEYLESDYQ